MYLMERKDAPLRIQAAENAVGIRTELSRHVSLRYGIYIMHKAINASECMINKKPKQGQEVGMERV